MQGKLHCYYVTASNSAHTNTQPCQIPKSNPNTPDCTLLLVFLYNNPTATLLLPQGKPGNPNCLCNLIPPPKSYRKAGLWAKQTDALATLGVDPTLLKTPDNHTPIGLRNLGNTCYVNSVLQCLFALPTFRSAVYASKPEALQPDKEQQKTVIAQLKQLFLEMHHGAVSPVNPAPLANALQLDHAVQQDGQEFMKLFLTLLEGAFRTQHGHIANIIPRLFTGQHSYETMCHTCRQCSESSNRLQTFYELDIPVRGFKTLEESLSSLLGSEILQWENQYYCERCSGKSDATRRFKISSLPPLLCLSLQRFIFDFVRMDRVKVSDKLSFPLSLNMGGICAAAAAGPVPSSSTLPTVNKINNNGDDLMYDLVAVLLHKGTSALHGHYVAHIKIETAADDDDDGSGGDKEEKKTKWWRFDDETVTELGEKGPFNTLDHGPGGSKPIGGGTADDTIGTDGGMKKKGGKAGRGIKSSKKMAKSKRKKTEDLVISNTSDEDEYIFHDDSDDEDFEMEKNKRKKSKKAPAAAAAGVGTGKRTNSNSSNKKSAKNGGGDNEEVIHTHSEEGKEEELLNEITSSNAYLLLYRQRNAPLPTINLDDEVIQWLSEAKQRLEQEHNDKCEEYQGRKNLMMQQREERQEKVRTAVELAAVPFCSPILATTNTTTGDGGESNNDLINNGVGGGGSGKKCSRASSIGKSRGRQQQEQHQQQQQQEQKPSISNDTKIGVLQDNDGDGGRFISSEWLQKWVDDDVFGLPPPPLATTTTTTDDDDDAKKSSKKEPNKAAATAPTAVTSQINPIDNGILLCPHQKLDPSKVASLSKRISKAGWQHINNLERGGPELSLDDTCPHCLSAILDTIAATEDSQEKRDNFVGLGAQLEADTQEILGRIHGGDEEEYRHVLHDAEEQCRASGGGGAGKNKKGNNKGGAPATIEKRKKCYYLISRSWLNGWVKRGGKRMGTTSPTAAIECPHGRLNPEMNFGGGEIGGGRGEGTSNEEKSFKACLAKRIAIPEDFWRFLEQCWQKEQQERLQKKNILKVGGSSSGSGGALDVKENSGGGGERKHDEEKHTEPATTIDLTSDHHQQQDTNINTETKKDSSIDIIVTTDDASIDTKIDIDMATTTNDNNIKLASFPVSNRFISLLHDTDADECTTCRHTRSQAAELALDLAGRKQQERNALGHLLHATNGAHQAPLFPLFPNDSSSSSSCTSYRLVPRLFMDHWRMYMNQTGTGKKSGVVKGEVIRPPVLSSYMAGVLCHPSSEAEEGGGGKEEKGPMLIYRPPAVLNKRGRWVVGDHADMSNRDGADDGGRGGGGRGNQIESAWEVVKSEDWDYLVAFFDGRGAEAEQRGDDGGGTVDGKDHQWMMKVLPQGIQATLVVVDEDGNPVVAPIGGGGGGNVIDLSAEPPQEEEEGKEEKQEIKHGELPPQQQQQQLPTNKGLADTWSDGDMPDLDDPKGAEGIAIDRDLAYIVGSSGDEGEEEEDEEEFTVDGRNKKKKTKKGGGGKAAMKKSSCNKNTDNKSQRIDTDSGIFRKTKSLAALADDDGTITSDIMNNGTRLRKNAAARITAYQNQTHITNNHTKRQSAAAATAALPGQRAYFRCSPPVCMTTVRAAEAAMKAARLVYTNEEIVVEVVVDEEEALLLTTTATVAHGGVGGGGSGEGEGKGGTTTTTATGRPMRAAALDGGERKSKRARKGRAPLMVSSTLTVGDLKLRIYEAIGVHPKNSRLFLRGRQLDNYSNSGGGGAPQNEQQQDGEGTTTTNIDGSSMRTLGECEVFPGDEIKVVDTKEFDSEDYASLFGMSSDAGGKRRERQAERGFTGTALTGL